MHGDDVASSMTSITTQTVSKATEVFLEILKVWMARERQRKLQNPDDKSPDLSGGEVTYQRLKAGGEVSMLPSFSKEDFRELTARAKALDIPVSAVQEKEKENTLSVFFLKSDKEAVNSIVQDIVRQKLSQPEQTERMITVEKEQAEGFQMYCGNHDIPVTFLETTDGGVKCIFSSAYEKSIEKAAQNFKDMRKELQSVSLDVRTENGKPGIAVIDTGQGKKIEMNFCTMAKLERVMKERLGFDGVKAHEAANALTSKLTPEQQKYFLSGSRQLEQMSYYERNIRFEDDNILTDGYCFNRLQLQKEKTAKLTVTDEKTGKFAVLSENITDRKIVEQNIRRYLGLQDDETVNALLNKAQRLGFAQAPVQKQFKEYSIERDTQTGFAVTGGNTVLRLDLSDKKTAAKALTDTFGMTASKAERVIRKAADQSVTENLLNRIKNSAAGKMASDALRHKKKERGSRT